MSSPGDVLGNESCIDHRTTSVDFSTTAYTGHRSFTPAKKVMKKQQQPKEYPPPLPSLGIEMKRYYTRDGRLIIKEEKTSRRHHDIFRADRSNGRLTLHFVHSEDENDCVLNEHVFQMEDVGDDDDECCENKRSNNISSSSSVHISLKP